MEKPIMGKAITGAGAARPWLARGAKITDDTKRAFLFALAELGNEAEAAAVAGCSASGIRRHADPDAPCFDPEFAEAWANAKEDFVAMLHRAAVSRAVDGWDEPIIGGEYRNEIVAHKKLYSDKLLELVLKRHDKQYTDRVQIESSKQVTHNHRLDISTLSQDQRRLVRQILEAQEQKTITLQAEPQDSDHDSDRDSDHDPDHESAQESAQD